MKRIQLTNSPVCTLVDDETFDRIGDKCCSLTNCGYVQLAWEGRCTTLHRLVIDAQKGQEVDHVNRDKLDNRRDNLRFVTRSENMLNVDRSAWVWPCLPRCANAEYKGITRRKNGLWMAQVKTKGKRLYKYSRDPLVAAKAYDELAKLAYGNAAILNFPD